MTYSSATARQELLGEIAFATERVAYALADLGSAYEKLDERTADRLEEELFGPVQRAFGELQRTHASFAARHGLEGRSFEAGTEGSPSTRAKGFIDSAVELIQTADHALSELQDSDPFIEIGDAELRDALRAIRERLGPLPGAARELLRGLGR